MAYWKKVKEIGKQLQIVYNITFWNHSKSHEKKKETGFLITSSCLKQLAIIQIDSSHMKGLYNAEQCGLLEIHI